MADTILEQFDFSVASMHLLDGPRPSYEHYDKAEWHTRGIKQGLKIARTILEEVLKAQPIFPPGEPPAAAQPAIDQCKTCRGSGFVAYSTHAGGAEGEGCPDCAPSDPPSLHPPASAVQQDELRDMCECEHERHMHGEPTSGGWADDCRFCMCNIFTLAKPPASAVSPTQPKRENFLRLAHKISDIARGNDGVVDPEHDVDTCDVCGRVADLIIDFVTPDPDPLSSVVSPREEPK